MHRPVRCSTAASPGSLSPGGVSGRSTACHMSLEPRTVNRVEYSLSCKCFMNLQQVRAAQELWLGTAVPSSKLSACPRLRRYSQDTGFWGSTCSIAVVTVRTAPAPALRGFTVGPGAMLWPLFLGGEGRPPVGRACLAPMLSPSFHPRAVRHPARRSCLIGGLVSQTLHV